MCQTGSGQPGLPTRLVTGLFILKHMHNLSDEGTPTRDAARLTRARGHGELYEMALGEDQAAC